MGEEVDDEEEEEVPIKLKFPSENKLKIIAHLLSLPALLPLCLTLPDVKNNEFTIFPGFKIPGTYTNWPLKSYYDH